MPSIFPLLVLSFVTKMRFADPHLLIVQAAQLLFRTRCSVPCPEDFISLRKDISYIRSLFHNNSDWIAKPRFHLFHSHLHRL